MLYLLSITSSNWHTYKTLGLYVIQVADMGCVQCLGRRLQMARLYFNDFCRLKACSENSEMRKSGNHHFKRLNFLSGLRCSIIIFSPGCTVRAAPRAGCRGDPRCARGAERGAAAAGSAGAVENRDHRWQQWPGCWGQLGALTPFLMV